MFAKVLLIATLVVVSMGLPNPDKPQRSYRPPQPQYSQPEPQYFQPAPQPRYQEPEPQPRYTQPEPQYRPKPQPRYSEPEPEYKPQPRYQEPPQDLEPPKYDFNWAVKDDYSGNDFGQEESRDGYNTKGSYYVLLPDGRRQVVTYYVNGDSGFIADVQYEGEARYPEPKPSYQPKPQPSYQPQPKPQPSYQPQPQPSYQPEPQRQYSF